MLLDDHASVRSAGAQSILDGAACHRSAYVAGMWASDSPSCCRRECVPGAAPRGLGCLHRPGRRLRARAPGDGYPSVTSSSAPASSSCWGSPAACLPRFFGLKSPETPSPTAPAAPAIAPPALFTAVSACGSSGTPSPSRSTLRNGRVTTSAALATPVPTATAPMLTPAPTAFAASSSASSALFGSLSAFSGFSGNVQIGRERAGRFRKCRLCGVNHFTPEDESGDSTGECSGAVPDCRLLPSVESAADVFKDPGLHAADEALRGPSWEGIRKGVCPVPQVRASAGAHLWLALTIPGSEDCARSLAIVAICC